MTKIHELPTVLADQIAAGEVVERPASVVKELVENAVDAHATTIDVLVDEAGLKTIQIVDDGDGISDDDVELAFSRHATSKITSREDLFRVHSLGFRGEALPSIASVADVWLKTATGKGAGSEVHIKGGELVSHTAGQSRPGTEVTVSDLFFNTPARLKYLKSPQTELANIVDMVNRIALGHPDVAFSLTHNGRELLRTAGRGDVQQVIAGIYGVQTARKMVAISGEDADFKLTGYVSLPELTRASRNYISILINGRYIKNFQLTKALIKGYGSKLMVGRYPLAVLNLTMDPFLVDVNVHPTKQEVRLSKEAQLGDLIDKAVYNRLAQENLIPDAYQNLHGEDTFDANQLADQLSQVSATRDGKVQVHYARPQASENAIPGEQTAFPETSAAALPDALPTQALTPIVIHHASEMDDESLTAFDARYQKAVAPFAGESAPTVAVSQEPMEMVPETKASTDGKQRFPDLTYIGQMHGTFLFAQAADGLYLVDQHAAQERIKYEYYRVQIGEVSRDLQNLLVPIVLDYPTSDVLKINDQQAALAELGLILEPFGNNSFIVRQHPTWFVAGQEEATIREMIDWILNDHSLTVAKFREKTAIMMSCKRSIKSNHHLDERQARALLHDLAQTENPFNCPHGRPVVVHFTNADMEKMFKRIQDAHEAWAEFDEHEF
ncbi:DNA mismatch repair endonuclease MutL [Furfurilactobacillus siliginis]|uniref:DNA mismatch repair protein MutL n=1 Tax=Furfurilactobacillus siliginis TaxID=348151 RepID=A0A0R2L1A7_9LACO|nr:DNA mismatch repair endonuclease MutL [Furfurilactobacillus siliginis]KRN95454.1 DNA mismatch repair protein MutL [Furfurilactobacillus siliginis]GEK28227.1 DNA mismatch repair protein MutL [Furfurilactobacillus siliginis]